VVTQTAEWAVMRRGSRVRFHRLVHSVLPKTLRGVQCDLFRLREKVPGGVWKSSNGVTSCRRCLHFVHERCPRRWLWFCQGRCCPMWRAEIP
jgi:hypothetical protein